MTGAYKSTLFFLTACVNSDGFKGFAPGEVLFLGASGTQRGQEDWEITFKFAASPNATGLVHRRDHRDQQEGVGVTCGYGTPMPRTRPPRCW